MADVDNDVKKVDDEKKEVFTKEEVLALVDSKIKEGDTKLKEAVEKEKAKLYDTIEAEKKRASELEKKLKEKEKEEAELRKSEEDKKKAEMDAIQRVDELEKTIAEDRKRFSELVELKDTQFNSELQKRDLALAKEKIIARHNGAIIPELVSGATEAELEESAQRAAERFKQIAEQSKQTVMDEFVKEGRLPKPGDIDSSIKKSSGSKNLQDVLQMTKEEYEDYKKTVFSQLK